MSSLIIAFSMYSKIPMPKAEWNEKNMKYSMAFFPLIGLVIGVLFYYTFKLMIYLRLPAAFSAAILSILPVLINGGIHLDGFLDTADALCSYKSKEEKLEILKDPHIGSFALIYGAVYGLCFFAFMNIVNEVSVFFIASAFVLSRILSAISVVSFPKAQKDGSLKRFSDTADKKVFAILISELLIYMLVIFIGAAYLGHDLHICIKAVLALSQAAVFLYYYKISLKNFGGINGDQAGYFLCICELVYIIVVCTGGYLWY